MDNFDFKKYLAEGKLLKEDEGTYRVYMNSDMDEPERIDYEIYFGEGTKAEMVKQAKEMAYSNDPTNQYGDPILVKVTHEDDIDDVAWTNVPVNEGLEKNNKVLVKLLKEYSEDYIVVYDKTLKKVIKKFINNKDGYYSGRSKARRFVDDMVKSSDTPFDNLSNYEIGKETEYRSMEESVNEDSTPSIEDVRLYIQKELGRAGEQDAGLDAYIDSIQRDFAAGRDAYDDYEMDDYLEDFENYIADKMDY